MFKKNILYKSINLEVFKNFLGCLTILFILVASSRLLGYFDKSIAGNLESDLILSILILRSPEFINLLIPLSFFLSVLIALGRLYMDHEIYAYQSAGYSKMAFVKSLLFQTFSLTVISVFLSFYVTPDFEKRADEMLNYSSIEKKLKLLNEDELSHISDSSYLYFSSRNGNYFNQSIFIEDDANGISIISAERLKLIEKNRATDFEFLNGKIFFDAASPNSLVSSFKMLTTDFNEKDSEEESFERVFNIDELSDKAQFEWALAVPLMIINLMILGVCLTNSAPRQGRMISLLPGLLIFFLYLSTLIVFRDGISENKSFAYFGMWPVHFLVLLTSIFLFVRGDVVSKILFSIIGDIEDLNEEFTLNDLIFTTLYRLFHDSMDYVQGSCLLGALISLGLFKRDGNITIIRSNGLSPIKISLIFALGPIIFSLLMISLDNKLFIQAANHAETFNSQISRDKLDIKFSWIKDGNKILRYSQKRESEIFNPTLIILDENDSVKEIISSEKAEVSDGLIKIDNSEFRFYLPKDKNLDRSTVKNIPIGSLKNYLRGSEANKLEDKEKNFIVVEILKRILLPISALLLILAASMLFFRDQRNNSFGSYVVGGFLGAFVFNLTQEFFFSMSLTIQSNIVAISLMPYLLLLVIFYLTYKRI